MYYEHHKLLAEVYDDLHTPQLTTIIKSVICDDIMEDGYGHCYGYPGIAAKETLIVISPKVFKLGEKAVKAILSHELGHAISYLSHDESEESADAIGSELCGFNLREYMNLLHATAA